MPAGNGAAKLWHLSWRANGDNLDVALAVNRALAVGARAWRLRAREVPFDAGDYLLELTARGQAAIGRLGLKTVPWEGRVPGGAHR